MRYLPKSPADRAAMLNEIGVGSIDDLFATVPAEYRLQHDLKIPRQLGESEIIDYFKHAASLNASGLRELSRRGRLSPLQAGHHRLAGAARRVSDLLHALPAGDHSRHAAGDLRVSDHDLRTHRHGHRQRLDV